MGEDEFKVRCVKASDAGDENDISKAMMDAYKSLKAEGFTPVWMTPKECLNIKRKEKNCVYLFDPFEGRAFEHIKSLCCRFFIDPVSLVYHHKESYSRYQYGRLSMYVLDTIIHAVITS